MVKLSWKTSVGGTVAVLSGLGMLGKILNDFANGQPIQFQEIAIAISTIGGGLGLIAARDNDVTSEEAGAK